MAIEATFDQKDVLQSCARGSILVEVYPGHRRSGESTKINTCVSLGGDRRVLSLTWELS